MPSLPSGSGGLIFSVVLKISTAPYVQSVRYKHETQTQTRRDSLGYLCCRPVEIVSAAPIAIDFVEELRTIVAILPVVINGDYHDNISRYP
jgi:hypothetical protein